MKESSIPATNVVSIKVGDEMIVLPEQAYSLMENGLKTDTDYVRPKGFLSKFVNRGLGPLPAGFKNIDDISSAWLFVRKWHRIVGSISAILIWFAMVFLMTLYPWMVMSPFSIVANLFQERGVGESSPIVAIITLTIMAISLIASLVWFRRFRSWMTKMAIQEEMWFRAGAEKWSYGQRIYSCVAFSFAHIFNLIYPIGVLIVLVLAGGIFMAVYLHIYKKTGDAYQAALASARVHAVYNITSIYWFAGVVVGINALLLIV